jgi:acyl-CoA synthetase (NDP forming)
MGLINLVDGMAVWLQRLNYPLTPGNVAMVAQSGSVCIALMNNTRNLRFSHVVSSGNESWISSAEYLEHLVEEPAVALIVNHLERIADGPRYLAVLERASNLGKPVVILKAGRSERGREAILGHTGEVTGEDRVARSILREYGAVVVDSVDELLDVSVILSARLRPQGRRTAVVSVSGGFNALAADSGLAVGLDFPAKLVGTDLGEEGRSSRSESIFDAWSRVDTGGLRPLLRGLSEAENIDTVVMIQDLPSAPTSGSPESYQDLVDDVVAVAASCSKSIVWITPLAESVSQCAVAALDAAGVPCLRGMRQGLQALAHAAHLAEWMQLDKQRRRRRASGVPRGAASRRVVLTEAESMDWLEVLGIPFPPSGLARTAGEAELLTRRLRFPVVLKKLVKNEEHKARHGHVRLGIATASEVRDAFTDLWRTGNPAVPRDPGEAVLIAEQVGVGLELMIALVVDEAFGAVVLLGLGGIAAGLNMPPCIRLAPVSPQDAASMVEEQRLDSVVGRLWPQDAKRIIDRLCWLLARVSALASTGSGLTPVMLELNPVAISLQSGEVVVLDALVQLSESAEERRGRAPVTL